MLQFFFISQQHWPQHLLRRPRSLLALGAWYSGAVRGWGMRLDASLQLTARVYTCVPCPVLPCSVFPIWPMANGAAADSCCAVTSNAGGSMAGSCVASADAQPTDTVPDVSPTQETVVFLGLIAAECARYGMD